MTTYERGTLSEKTYRVAWDEDTLVLEARLSLMPDGRPQLWNGWVCPEFDRANIDRYIAFLATAKDAEMYEKAEWDGDVLVLTDPDYPDEPTRIEPCPHGLYGMGSWAWTWYLVDEPSAEVVDNAGLDSTLRSTGGRSFTWYDLWDKGVPA